MKSGHPANRSASVFEGLTLLPAGKTPRHVPASVSGSCVKIKVHDDSDDEGAENNNCTGGSVIKDIIYFMVLVY